MVPEGKINNFLENLAEALELQAECLSKDTKLDSISWDSLAVISCIALADEFFGVMLSGEELSKAITIEDIINLILEKV
ncbi:acyl carrier protein [uncultured Prochlorococcus sp.]|uniref:acyl carrier protein n=1 Tax=uncultured Prochlorococcus sp. TaxID=159733 RepID=UPI0025847F98|nr:acyl carrier protein [uncultured Prochlorococcus sp.]